MSKVALIFPPGTHPRSPRLPLPALAATLRKAGVRADLFDLDIEGLLFLLRPGNLIRAGEGAARNAAKATGDRRRWLGSLAAQAPALAETMEDALATMRDPARFISPSEWNAARERIIRALDLVSAAASRPVRYQVELIRYEVEGVDTSRLEGLLEATADPAANLFEEHWDAEVFPALDRESWDFVGISITLRFQIVPALALARRLRERGHRVILGGTALTKFADRLPRLPAFFDAFADGAVIYEGDTAVLELLDQIHGKRDFSKVPNFLYREGSGVHVPSGIHVEDYASLPTPDFEGMPLDRYLNPELVLPLLVGKGCYHDECKFCDIPYINHVAKKRYRTREPETVAADVRTLADRHDCRRFFLGDEALPPRLLEEIADALEPDSGRGLVFGGYARFEPGFTREVCAKIARMGLRKIFFGLESASQATLDHMKKGIEIGNVRPILANCVGAGIHFHVFSMIGFPEEGEASARETISFFQKNADLFEHPGNTFDVHPLELLARTSYFREAAALGVVIDAETTSRDFITGVGTRWENTRGLRRDEIEALLAEVGGWARARFTRYHAWPPILWPAHEEWTVHYLDPYGSGSFPYRVSLPADSDPTPFRLRWNPAAVVERSGEIVSVSTTRGAFEMDEQGYAALGCDPGFRPAERILDDLAGGGATPEEVSKVRELVTRLARAGFLFLDPWPGDAPPAGAALSGSRSRTAGTPCTS